MLSRLLAGERRYVGLVAVWPFLFLWIYVAGIVLPGNDFNVLYYNYKLYLLAFLADGHFPRWSFGEAGGFPFFSSPFTQPLYPLNALYLLHYAVLGGLSPWDYTMYTIFAFSIFAVGLYLWLRSHGIDSAAACAATLIATVSVKVTELLRFPNAAHAAAWIPWLLLGVSLATNRDRRVAAWLTIAAGVVLLITAGYPYYFIYSLFLLGPYTLLMSTRAGRRSLGRMCDHEATSQGILLTVGSASGAGVAVCLPWLLHMRALMAQTVDRATPSLAFASLGQSSPLESLGSWVYPPAAQIEGWYYFGVGATILVFTHLILGITGRSGFANGRAFAALAATWLFLADYFTWGTGSRLFLLVWHSTPVLNQMRVWSRMHIILVPVIALVLARGVTELQWFLSSASEGNRRRGREFRGLFVGVGLTILMAQAYLIANDVASVYWPFYFKRGYAPAVADSPWPIHLAAHYDPRVFAAATVLVLFMFAWLAVVARRGAPRIGTALVAFVIVSSADLYGVSNLQWPIAAYPYDRQRISTAELLQDGVERPRLLARATVDPVGRTTTVGLLENWGFMRHAAVLYSRLEPTGAGKPTTTEQEAAATLRFFGADADGRRVFVTGAVDHASLSAFIADADRTEASGATARLEFFDGDSLRASVTTDSPSWLTYVDNWDANWTATVNGAAVRIAKPFGSYKAVPVPAGRSVVTFSYDPPLLPAPAAQPE